MTRNNHINLAPHIPEPGQYRVTLITAGGKEVALCDELLLQQGQVSAPGILRRVDGVKNMLHISRTAAVTRETCVRLRMTIKGDPCPGVVLIKTHVP